MTEKEIINHQQIIVQLIIEAQRKEVVEYIEKLALDRGYYNVINDMLEPALIEIGEMWSHEKLSLAQGYVAAKVTEDILEIAAKSKEWQKEIKIKKIPVVLANIEDDFHSLGRKMIGTFLKASGWDVFDMGNDVIAVDIVNKAVELNAPVIGVSAMMYTSALNIKKVREEIDKRNLQSKIKLAVGGAIFKVRPKLVEEVGGDGTAQSAIHVPELFSELLKKVNYI